MKHGLMRVIPVMLAALQPHPFIHTWDIHEKRINLCHLLVSKVTVEDDHVGHLAVGETPWGGK